MGKRRFKSGFSRKQTQKMTKLAQMCRLYGISETPSDNFVFVQSEDGKYIKAKPNYSAYVKKSVGTNRRLQKARLAKYGIATKQSRTINSVAAQLVTDSSREVLEALGLKNLDVSAQPEIVHTIGRMVATRAVSMAKEFVVAGSAGGKGRIGAGGIIASIARTGLDVEISPSGKVSAKVSTKTTRKNKAKKSSKSSETKVAVPAEVPSKTDGGTIVEVGHKSVVQRKDGSTSIHIDNLNIYITVVHADDMIVSQQSTVYKVESHKDEIAAAVVKKEPDEVIVEDDEDENDKKKKKEERQEKHE